MSTSKGIVLRGVRQNNLKGIDCEIPLRALTVVTGLSGSGKSSLVFDTLHAEGQRRYVETFSAYTRQFLDMLDKPAVDHVEHIPPSIAIEQANSVRTSRSTVGTMTELCDYFKVWFCHQARLHDPATGAVIECDSPDSAWRKALETLKGETVRLTFAVAIPAGLEPAMVVDALVRQGYTRAWDGRDWLRIDEQAPDSGIRELHVLQDSVTVAPAARQRFLDSARTAIDKGHGTFSLRARDGAELRRFSSRLVSPATGQVFKPAEPPLFSFNTPLGACPACKGFGRVIETDMRLVIPDANKSLRDGAIKPFSGDVYGKCLDDLERAAKARRLKLSMTAPWASLDEAARTYVIEGDPDYAEGTGRWYGVKRFFGWLEEATYKMHVRVFLSRFRAYVECPACHGDRFRPEAAHWRWEGRTLADLYRLDVRTLLGLLRSTPDRAPNPGSDAARKAIQQRLEYLDAVGLPHLTLDRLTRTLSGGEVERVNLATCLGAALTDALFVLDEPTVGLHAGDIARLNAVMRRLVDQGNTVVVVEHDESVMRAADHLVEIGPGAGKDGGTIVFQGPMSALATARGSLTADYLCGRRQPAKPPHRPCPKSHPVLRIEGATLHNLRGLDVAIPLNRLVCLTGVSGSGKSTLLESVIHHNLLIQRGIAAEDAASVRRISCPVDFEDVTLVDQSPVVRTSRSNALLFTGAWDAIRKEFASTPEARDRGLSPGTFSFNTDDGRCPHCEGLGTETIEMQFMADIHIPCPVCQGRRFKPFVLEIRWRDLAVDEFLRLTVSEARARCADLPGVDQCLADLEAVGLGYLPVGQPLNTLSGGEAQRLKLVRFLQSIPASGKPSLLLLDEPTTGLHRDDVNRLTSLLHRLVDNGHSLVVIEHNLDVVRAADWVLELGPGSGPDGGRLVFAGTVDALAKSSTATAPFLAAGYGDGASAPAKVCELPGEVPPADTLRLRGAHQNNLKGVDLDINHGELTVVTGVSGSGKSTLAFDIIFAEGQRRFMESMSPYARQFVEQLPRPLCDSISGVQPTVAIEQRASRGSRKSTVATITEVAQHLRLLYARAGVRHNPATGEALQQLSEEELLKRFMAAAPGRQKTARDKGVLLAPVVLNRKGHHKPLVARLRKNGIAHVWADGDRLETRGFEGLDRYSEHTVYAEIPLGRDDLAATDGAKFLQALRLGSGTCLHKVGERHRQWFSVHAIDPATGESFPPLTPKHFSWNSDLGWCPTCRGLGKVGGADAEDADDEAASAPGGRPRPCPDCRGGRLNAVSRSVRLPTRDGRSLNLPGLLQQTPAELLATLGQVELDARGTVILRELLPEIRERLRFMDAVGLGYLPLDRDASSLSGGEAQRIRLAAQLGSTLSGVLYVLDEPSIGLHAHDNRRLIEALRTLQARGNTLLVVEHDEETMRAADRLVDIGPGAGIHGGEVLASGSPGEVLSHADTPTARFLRTGIRHPLLGAWRKPPSDPAEWIGLRGACMRNLKDVDLRIPRGRLTVVCGASGAGKSTLVRETLKPALEALATARKQRMTGKAFLGTEAGRALGLDAPPFANIEARQGFRTVIEVDQAPIGKTSRSTPATYTGIFDRIRECFAMLPEARQLGFTASTFSFNTAGGRCPTCNGAGEVTLEMGFLPSARIPCEDCGGSRYGAALRELRWRGLDIAAVNELTFEEAAAFFDFNTAIRDRCALMVEAGLGYLRLGQGSPTLSGGEAQRLKLATELARGLESRLRPDASATNLYILEEPTIGLHATDCERLIRLVHRLCEQGHTVVLIEHNLDLIAEADWLVELGPTGGVQGGHLLHQGPLADILRHETPTSPYLRKLLGTDSA